MTYDFRTIRKEIRRILRYKESDNEDGVYYFRGKRYWYQSGTSIDSYFEDFFDIEEIYSLGIIPRDTDKAIEILLELMSNEDDRLYYFFAQYLLRKSFMDKHLLSVFKSYLSHSRPTMKKAAIKALFWFYIEHSDDGLDFLLLMRDHLKIERFSQVRHYVIEMTELFGSVSLTPDTKWKSQGTQAFHSMLEYILKHDKNEENLTLVKDFYKRKHLKVPS